MQAGNFFGFPSDPDAAKALADLQDTVRENITRYGGQKGALFAMTKNFMTMPPVLVSALLAAVLIASVEAEDGQG